jgi:hypothetical protein
MRNLWKTSTTFFVAAMLASSQQVQAQLINGNGGTVDPTQATGVMIAPSANAAVGLRIINTVNTAELLRVQTDGKVGIGTAAPGWKMEVQSASNATGFLLDATQFALGLTNPGAPAGAYSVLAFARNGGQALSAAIGAKFRDITAPKTDLLFATGNEAGVREVMRIDSAGNLGVDAPSPTSRLEIGHIFPVQFQDLATNGGGTGMLLNMPGTSLIHVGALNIGESGSAAINVGFDTTTRGYPLFLQSVSGDVIIGGGSGSGAHGNLTVNGTIYANYQDVAEWVPAAGSMAPGTVVVISDDSNNTVTPSTRAYDTGVAGVVSPTPGLLLGVASESKAKIATTGRVRVRVDASKGAIRKGDLLVTSDRPGMAMKSEPIDVAGVKIHRPGTLIGKALEPLASGQGEVLVLLSLQ